MKEPSVKKPFKLSSAASAKLDNYLAQIRQGIKSVCELHSYDSTPSLKKKDFEEQYIDRLLGQTATALSVSIRSYTDALRKQNESEAAALFHVNTADAENKKETAS